MYEVAPQHSLDGPYDCCSADSAADHTHTATITASSSSSSNPATAKAAAAAAMPAADAVVMSSSHDAILGQTAAAASAVGGLKDALALPRRGYSHMVYVCRKPC